MATKFNVRIWDEKTKVEITEGIGFVDINDREHYGRKFITVDTPVGDKIEARNVGILNPNGSVEAQPGYHFEVTEA